VPAVAHLIPALFAEDDGIVGGAERYAYELARHMSRVVPTSLVSFGARARDERVGDLRIRVIGDAWHVRHQRSNPFAFALLDEVRRADVVHCHQQHIVASTSAALACRMMGKRVFCSDLGGGGWDLSSYVSTDALYHGHLHISEYSRHIAGHDALASARVIWGGVDLSKFSPDPTISRTRRVLFVGRVLPHKGVDTLVRALPADLALDIVGHVRDDRYLADLHRLAAGKQVSFHHAFDDDALVAAYRAALCIVLPSVYDDMYGGHTDVPELLGQTLLEGMACGTPAIGTRVASIPEIVDDGVNGYLVPQNDPAALERALRCLADDPSRASQMGAAARRRVADRFSWPGVVSACLEAYAA
jgi:glycosyltransferase involved in cell wall biosynthesis